MVIFSHPTGNANSRAAADGLLEKSLLSEFHTSIAVFPESLLYKTASVNALAELKRRTFNPKLKEFTITHPFLETARLIASKSGFKNLVAHETGPFCIDAIYSGIDKNVADVLSRKAKSTVKAVYGYEDAAMQSFTKAKEAGIQCLYDLPIGYWRSARKYLEAELEIWPEWAPTLGGFKDSKAKLDRKDEELRLADTIFVASSFTAKTLTDYPGKLAQVEVIPYGFPDVGANRNYARKSDKIKLLFVGGLSQRKGLANLFAAVEKLSNHVELTIVGGKGTEDCQALNKALSKYKWIPSLPHAEILNLMRENDVLVFPSLFEGFGLVITEAMSQGTPVITTDRTAGADLINHGHNGWIVEAGSTNALQYAIENIIANPELIEAVGTQAKETARQRPWAAYGQELALAVEKSIKKTLK